MGVSRSAYYGWLHTSPTRREQADAALTPVIQAIFTQSRATYGARRIRQSLLRQNLSVGRGRIGRLMGVAGLACKTNRKFKATTNSKHNLPVADNLLDRQFTVDKPDLVYAGNITDIHTREGWLYLAVVIDLLASGRARVPRLGTSRKGNCWEDLPLGYNAVSESFFHTLKTELVHHRNYQIRVEAKQEIFEYIDVFYNRERLHTANNYWSPVDYEM